jgi:hypothetical protein
MSRRREPDEAALPVDSFLDIVTNVVGVLVLVAMVTVLSTGNITVPSGATAMVAPNPSAARVLFECAGDEVLLLDEAGNAERVLDEVRRAGEAAISRDGLVALLDENDVGDETHRVRAERLSRGVAWVYSLRDGARGERIDELDREGSRFQQELAGLERGGFAYFIVHDDSFEAFRRAREIARARGIAVGWHPVEGRGPVRLSALGSLGKRIQ